MKDAELTLSNSDKLGLMSNFSTLLSAGISLLETVDSLLEDAKGHQKELLLRLRADIVQGKRVSDSFSRFPQIFDKVTVSIIRASEEAGTLDRTLKDLKENIRKENEFTDKIRTSLIYPLLIVCLFFAVLFVILVFVIPKISTVFESLHVNLPLPTKILIFLSNLILKYTIPLILSLGVAVLLLYLLYKKKKRFFINLIISLPLISDLVKQIDLTRMTRSLYYLLTSGISIITALDLAKDVVVREDIAQIIENSRQMILSGKRLSAGLRTKKGVVPPIMIKIIEAGEKTGSLDKSMQDVSEYLDYQVNNTLKILITLLEPVMLVVVGIFVGGMMMAIIAPIYGLIGQVGVAR